MKDSKKILIVGNHTCGNRGDSAILRGLIQAIEEIDKCIEFDITSRFPDSSSYLLERTLIPDELHRIRTTRATGRIRNTVKKIREQIDIRILEARVSGKGMIRHLPLSSYLKKHIAGLKKYDAVIQVGGSFFVDSYGIYQFEHSLCSLLANKPLLILGHSVGPFSGSLFRKISNTVFNKAGFLGLREDVSLEIIKQQLNITNTISMGTDTAWCVSPPESNEHNHTNISPVVALTVRNLSPFDKKLKVKQSDYENKIAHICSILIKYGARIRIVSTCTGIEGYKNDDRIVALRIRNLCRLAKADNFEVLMNEYNDVELGEILSKCDLTIGTRLHSAIISMNFGTPAFALNYEHKSEGIMKNLNMPELSVSFAELMNGTFEIKMLETLKEIEKVKEDVKEQVFNERRKAFEFISKAINNIPMRG